MVVGVTQGYEKKLEVNGVGYRAAKSGNKLTLSLGYSHPVEMEDPEGIETVMEGQNIIIVKGKMCIRDSTQSAGLYGLHGMPAERL